MPTRRGTYLSDQPQLSLYRLDPLGATRPGGCSDEGTLHCSTTSASKQSMAQVGDPVLFGRSPYTSGDPPCGVNAELERSCPMRRVESLSGIAQQSKTSLKEQDMSRYYMTSRAPAGGYTGLDHTMFRSSRALTANQKEAMCPPTGRRTYARYA